MKIKIIFLITVCLTVGCSKDISKSENPIALLKSAEKIIKIETPENLKNPADSIGIIHNQALLYVYKKLIVKKDLNNEIKRKYAVEFFEKRYGEHLMKSIQERDDYYRRYDNIPILRLTEKLPCSDVLAHTVKTILFSAYEMKSPSDYNAFKQKIIILEQKIMNGELKASKTEVDQLLHFTSVIRHSMWFWMDAVTKGQNQNETEFLRGFLKGLLGGMADAHGALVSLLSYASFRYVLEDASTDSAMMLWAFGY